MKLMFTSFDAPYLKSFDAPFKLNSNPYHAKSNSSIFQQMPPVRMTISNKRFEPDYTALLLCDKIILDEESFDLLKSKPHSSYKVVSETINALYWEGFIELFNFGDIVQKRKELLTEMVNIDLSKDWIEQLEESIDIWMRMKKKNINPIKDEVFYLSNKYHFVVDMKIKIHRIIKTLTEMHPSSHKLDLLSFLIKGRFQQKDILIVLESIIKLHLLYVNSNIIISSEIGVGFYDWADLSPFYEKKFDSLGFEKFPKKHLEASRALFEISFPEFSIKNTKTLLRVLEDKRIIDLRKIIQNAVDGKVAFDNQFARQVLMDVLKLERRTNKYRSIISYLTMPINFVPGLGPLVGTFAPKFAEEIAGRLVESKVRENYSWFYMLSDIVDNDK